MLIIYMQRGMCANKLYKSKIKTAMKQKLLLLTMMLCVLVSCTTEMDDYLSIPNETTLSSTTGEALYDIAAVLTTRQGDKIVLRTGDAETATDAELRNNENASIFSQKANAIALEKQEFYDLEIRINSSTRLNPTMGTPLCIDLGKIDESSMYVYSNPRTGIQYIYDRENKIAFSHLVDDIDGDWILDEYGIRDWVESLTTKSIALATIANSYKIIGL